MTASRAPATMPSADKIVADACLPGAANGRANDIWRSPTAWALALALGLLFWALAYLGIHLTRETGRIAAVWVANGVAVAFLLRSPRRFAPLLIAGVFVGNLTANLLHADPLLRALALASGNLLEIGLVVLLTRSALRPGDAFDNGAVIGRFLAAVVAGSSAAGVIVALLLGLIEGAAFLAIASRWILADMLGMLVVGSFLLSLPARRTQWDRPRKPTSLAIQVERGAIVIGLLGIAALLSFGGVTPLLFMLGPLFVLAAFRLPLAVVCLTICACAAMAITATWAGMGPAATFARDPALQLYALQAFIASMVVLVLPVRALVRERNRLGEEAASSERKFVRIAEASTAGIMHVDTKGCPTWANVRWSELAGPTDLAKSFEEWALVVENEERGRLLTLWTEARVTHCPVQGEFRASSVAASGAAWLSLSIHPEYLGQARPNGFVVRIEDISARRDAEEQLAEKERRYRLVTENVSDIVLRIARDGTMIFASGAADRLLGFARGSLVGRKLRDVVHGEDWPEFDRVFRDALSAEAGETVRYRHRRFDGGFRWVEGSFRPVFDELTGEPIELVASVRDIHLRMRTEEVMAENASKLRESHRLISLAEDLAGVGHWRFDFDHGGFDYSVQINRIVGVPRSEVLSPRAALRRLDPESRAQFLSTFARARRAERPCECELVIEGYDGQQRRLRIVLQGDRDGFGRMHGMVGVVRDVTAERQARDELVRARDRAKAAAQAKAHFLATMSHEIRTPMTGVMGMIDLLMKNPDRADRVRYLDMLKTSADLLMAVLDDILDFSKIDSGQVVLERRTFALDRVLEESASLFERRATEKGLRLRFDHEGSALAVVGDEMRLRQVIANLLSNAIKFSEKGDILLSLQARVEDALTYLEIAVSDEGIGIAPEMRSQLFEPFMQADASTSRRFGGTGLGLAICRRLVEAMGGEIAIDSKPGEGSTFAIRLALATGALEDVHARDNGGGDGAHRRPCASLHLLVAEDNPVNQMLIGAMLRADGHQVTAVENGRLAVEAADQMAYDAIIMDMQMPEMDGLAATRAIRASGGPCAAAPILALTADASPERRRFYDGAGLSAFLTKPIDQELLLDQLRAIAGLGAMEKTAHGAARGGREPREPSEAKDGETPLADVPAPLFDSRQLAELRAAVGQQRLDELLALLDIELAQRPKAIAEALRRRDVDEVRRIAHSLKGASGSAGAAAVAAIAQGFEDDGVDHARLVERLATTAARTRKAIVALCEETPRRTAAG